MTARAEERLAYLGYAVVETKRHAPGLGDLNAEEARAVGETMNRVSAALKETQSAEHVYAFVQGDGVPHFHIHLVPRYAGTPPEYRHPMNLVHWPDAKRGGHEALQGIREALQARLHGS
ncbi:diadenosine tetraphosphate (Ap4A) HIT family hydrolase [Paenibacillus sacheonensis]|nr:diadenosine tetraphosphate (Ap4A) HIT family hydrolase [Paenibacillus sacheonensis]